MIEKQNLQNLAILTFHDIWKPNRLPEVKSENTYGKTCKRAIECFFPRPPNPYSSRATASFVGKCRPQSDYGEI